MPQVRYQVPGVPPQFSATAFAPPLARQAGGGAQVYKGALTGQPGTEAIPAPYPEVSIDPSFTSIHQSTDAPPEWYPQLYYQTRLTNLPPVAIYSDSCLPIPAANPVRPGAVLAARRKIGGRKQIKSVPIVADWAGG